MKIVRNWWSVGVVGIGMIYLIYVLGEVFTSYATESGLFFLLFFSDNLIRLLGTIVFSWLNAIKPSKVKAVGALIFSGLFALSMTLVSYGELFSVTLLIMAVIAVIKNPKADIFLPLK
jgi:hypothetical protein